MTKRSSIAAPELVERTLAAAARLAGCAVIVTESMQASLRWANSTMTTNGLCTDGSITVVALVAVPGGTAAGVAESSVAVTDPAQLAELVVAAEAAARDAGPAPDAMPLPDGPGGTDLDAAASTWADPAAETSIGVFARFVDGLAEVLAGPQRQYGFAQHGVTTTWLGTSTGVRRRWVQPSGSVELNAKTPDLSGSAWAGVSTRDFTDVDVVGLAATAARRLAWGARRVELPAGRYETVLPPSAVADLMVFLNWSMAGRPAQEGRSALAGPTGPRTGERLTGLPLTLASDPAAPGLEYPPFLATSWSGDGVSVFDNGAAVRRVDWIRDGVVHELAYSRAEAAEFGTMFAPPGENLLLTGGTDGTDGTGGSVEDLVGRTARGLLLTCLWYVREVDPTTLLLTGLTRDGVYLIEDGEVVGEVAHNFRFNHSPLDVLRRTPEVGATERTLPREMDGFPLVAMPPIRVPEFNMSSVSLGR